MKREVFFAAALLSLGLWLIAGVRWMSRGIDARVDERLQVPAARYRLVWRAARPLPMNHRLTDADLVAPPVREELVRKFPPKAALRDRYVRGIIAAGQPVLPANLAKEPLADAGVVITVKPRQLRVPETFPPGTAVKVNELDATVIAHAADGVQLAVSAKDARTLLELPATKVVVMEKAPPAPPRSTTKR